MKNVALVLSGGGARGCAHIGAIKVLEQNGFRITSVAGTSMGALVGGVYASGQLSTFEKWICSLDVKELLRLTDFSFSKQGFIKGKKVIQKIKEIIPDRNIEDLLIPFCAIATDIINETEVVFMEGNLYEAIRASISIPTVFLPHKIGDRYFVDGGLLNPVPVDKVMRTDGDILVVVDVNAFISYEKTNVEDEHLAHGRHFGRINRMKEKLRNTIPSEKHDDLSVFNLSNKSISTMMHKISELTLEKHRPDLLINISRESYSIYDFYKAKEIISKGEKATLEALKNNSFLS